MNLHLDFWVLIYRIIHKFYLLLLKKLLLKGFIACARVYLRFQLDFLGKIRLENRAK